ncbi:MAG: cytochrome b [Burkholderiales bacterium]|nr:cytochrome b [Burkholderiales bacterium]
MSEIKRYDAVARSLHWLIAILIIGEYLIGLNIDTFDNFKWLHIQVGLIILLLVFIRVYWRITHKYPKMDSSLSRSNQIMAKMGHEVMYLLMLIIPLLGLALIITKGKAMNIFGFNVPAIIEPVSRSIRSIIKSTHVYLAHAIIFMASFHALAALLHQFVHNRLILSRMLPKKIADIIEGKK